MKEQGKVQEHISQALPRPPRGAERGHREGGARTERSVRCSREVTERIQQRPRESQGREREGERDGGGEGGTERENINQPGPALL